ncbi:hypothetical protein R7Q53_004007 [Morganella morganii]|jgi:hypothetical protein|nr:hypothetical protein [Morganella morganii]|tara:strand:- start:13809 stop:14213 length:405 start_codon:yes stop_codon:yes gene_type:complete
MTKDSVADVLRALATGDKSRSETARLRDIVDEVEAALAAGVSRAAVLEALNDQGFTMTLKSFESALYRIRKKRTQPAKPTAKIGHDQIAAPASQPAQAPREEPTGEPQARITNPADIRKSRRREIDLDDLTDKE